MGRFPSETGERGTSPAVDVESDIEVGREAQAADGGELPV